MIVKTSLAFASLSDADLDNFARAVHDGLTGNPAFPSPPVTLASLQTAISDLTAKVAAAKAGGPFDTAAKNSARQTLVGMLLELAAYVEMISNNDEALLLSSGFEIQGGSGPSIHLEQPQDLSLKNGGSGELVASVEPVHNASMYEGRIRPNDGDWMQSVFTGDSQHIIFSGLQRGRDYTVEVRALGGTTGQSDWSDPSSLMAM